MALAMYSMNCWICGKFIGKYAATDLPIEIAYYNCPDCIDKNKRADVCYYCKKFAKVNGFLIPIKWNGGNTGYICPSCLGKHHNE